MALGQAFKAKVTLEAVEDQETVAPIVRGRGRPLATGPRPQTLKRKEAVHTDVLP